MEISLYTKKFSLEKIDTGVAEAEVNMSLDAQFLADLNRPILHFYDWARPSATFGHFIDLKKHVDGAQVERHGLAMAKRPTGGGIVFHIWDLAFSFLMPAELASENTLENYKFVNEVVLDVVREYHSLEPIIIPENAPLMGPNCNHFCMARPTIYDVVYNGRKIAGAAQRRTKKGYLHQGTISLVAPDVALLKDVLLSQEEIVAAMETFAFAPLQMGQLKKARIDLQELLHQKFLIALQ